MVDPCCREVRAGAIFVDLGTVLAGAPGSGGRHRGETVPVDPKAGHIPAARSAPAAANLSPDGRFLPPDELRRRYGAIVQDGPAIAHCGSGVTACHDLLAIEVAGLPRGRLHPGSWSAGRRVPICRSRRATIRDNGRTTVSFGRCAASPSSR